MKLNTLTIFTLGAGVVLLYAGLKDKNPKDVISSSLQGQSPGASGAAAVGTPVTPSVALHPAAKPPDGTAHV